MPVSGLVIVLAGRLEETRTAVETISGDARFTLGPVQDETRLPVVLETDSDVESRRALDELRTLPGVAMVQVAYVNYAPSSEEHAGHDP